MKKDTKTKDTKIVDQPTTSSVDMVNSRLQKAKTARAERTDLFVKIQKIYRCVKSPRAADDNRSNIAIPEVFSEVESTQAKATANQPKIDLTALNEDSEDFVEAAEQVIDRHWNRMNMERYFPLWVKVILKFGTGFAKLTWANEKGTKTFTVRKFDEKGNLVSEEPNQEITTRYDGTKCEIPNLLNIYPQPGTKEPKWIIESYLVDKSELYKNPNYDPAILDMLTPYRAEETPQREEIKKLDKDLSTVQLDEFSEPIMITEFWSDDRTDNRLVVVANHSKLLRDCPNPYGELPYVYILDQEDDQDFWGIGEIETNIGPQEALDTLENQMITANNIRLDRPFVYDKGAEIDIEDIEVGWAAGNGIGVKRRPGDNSMPIEWPDVPDISISGDNQAARMKAYMQSGSGANDFTKNSMADVAQDTLGGAQMMTEQQDERFQQKVRNIESGIKQLGEKILRYDIKFRTKPTSIPTTDEDGNKTYETIKPFNDDLQVEVIVGAGSTLPSNDIAKKNAELAFISQLSQIYPDDLQNPKIKEDFYEAFGKDPKKYLETDDQEEQIPEQGAQMQTTSDDVQEAEAEDELMARGKPVEVHPNDNDAIHIKIHGEVVNSTDFAKMPKQIQALYVQHLQQHENQLAIKTRGGQSGPETNGQVPAGVVPTPPTMGGGMPTNTPTPGPVQPGNPGPVSPR